MLISSSKDVFVNKVLEALRAGGPSGYFVVDELVSVKEDGAINVVYTLLKNCKGKSELVISMLECVDTTKLPIEEEKERILYEFLFSIIGNLGNLEDLASFELEEEEHEVTEDINRLLVIDVDSRREQVLNVFVPETFTHKRNREHNKASNKELDLFLLIFSLVAFIRQEEEDKGQGKVMQEVMNKLHELYVATDLIEELNESRYFSK